MRASTIFTALVDDEASVCKAVGLLLESAGFEVQTFRSGMEFIESLGDRRPDCVIIDIHMPEMTGFEVQARLNALGLSLPVIFITAFEDLDLAQRLKQAEAAGFLLKPFTDEELLGSIALAVGEAGNAPSIHSAQGEEASLPIFTLHRPPETARGEKTPLFNDKGESNEKSAQPHMA